MSNRPFLAPTAFWMLRMSLLGPTSMEVPVSKMAWQPPTHATTVPSIVILQRVDRMVPRPALLLWVPSGLSCQDPQAGRPANPLDLFPWAPSWSPRNFLSSEKRPGTQLSG